MGGPGSGRKKGSGKGISGVKKVASLNKLSKNSRIAKKQLENFSWGKKHGLTKQKAKAQRSRAIELFGK